MDAKTYESLIQPVEDRMTRTIWRIVRDREEALDTLQEALATIWKKMDYVCEHPNPHALILKICIDASYDSLRKHRRRDRNEEKPADEMIKRQSTNTNSPYRQLVLKQTETEILNAIGRLPKKQAVSILMRIVQDESYETIAQTLGCAETTVRIHVNRGRVKLREQLSHLNPSMFKEVADA
ncbi:MAG: RNA polymerase sigma factor [bacterium]|nr:RNA polymerase sigma factor [bacterium]